MKKKSQNAFKSFVKELVTKKTIVQQRRDEVSLKPFIIELVIFSALVVSYFFLVLSLLSDWIRKIFDQSKPIYAIVALVLIASQGVVLEIIAAALIKIVQSKIK